MNVPKFMSKLGGGGGGHYMGLSYNAHVALGFIKFMGQSQPTLGENPN